QALLALVRIHAPADRVRAALGAALADADAQVRAAAVQAVGKDEALLDARLTELLTQALADGNDQVKREAARAVPDLLGPTPAVLAGLGRLLQDDTEEVRLAVVQALGKLGPAAAPTGAAVLRAFQTSEG